jgi:ankyrin repeat protein
VGHVAAINMLCKAVKAVGKSPHDPDKHGWTPLHRAASAGHLDAVNALLKPEFGPIPAFEAKAGAGCSPAEREYAKSHALEGKVVTPWHVAQNEEIKEALKKALGLADDGSYIRGD